MNTRCSKHGKSWNTECDECEGKTPESDRGKIRYNVIFKKYSLWKRLSLWFYGVYQAARETPPKQYGVYVPLNPGEPGYDGAFFEMWVDQHPFTHIRPEKEP